MGFLDFLSAPLDLITKPISAITKAATGALGGVLKPLTKYSSAARGCGNGAPDPYSGCCRDPGKIGYSDLWANHAGSDADHEQHGAGSGPDRQVPETPCCLIVR